MREGHGSRASASGHVVVLQKRQETEVLLCNPKSQDASCETFHRKFSLGNLSGSWREGAAHIIYCQDNEPEA